MIELRNLTKVYNENAENQVLALDHVSFTLPETGMVFLLGKSGSGKTTMLNLLGGLDAASDGEIIVDDISSKDFTEADYDAYRNTVVGFVFQEYNLLQDFTVAGNLALALELQGTVGKKARAKTNAAVSRVLEQVDLAGYERRKPRELSGGQKQRVAIARALVKEPRIILADEPTGALDSKTGSQVLDVLKRLSREKLVVVVSHDRGFAEKYADRIIELVDGRVVRDDLQESAEDAAAVTYSNTAVRLQQGAPISPEEWDKLRQYIEDKEGDTLLSIGSKYMKPETISHIAAEKIQLINAKLPMKTALQMGLHGIKRKKLRLTMVVALCLVALLLFGMSDMFMSYDDRITLANSLYDNHAKTAAFPKETYLQYPDVSGWYGDYLLTDEDIAQLAQELDVPVKGVYCPPIVSMSLESNYYYTSAQATNYGLYAEKIVGFMDCTKLDLKQYDLDLLFGSLPDGSKDEIAISKYVAESFVLADYRPATPEVSICLKTEKNLSKEERSYHKEISWSEYLKLDKAALEAEGKTVSIWVSTSAEAKEILSVEAMVGKTLFLGLREYKITGIIDTGFDTARYAEVTEQDLRSEEDGGDLLAYIRASELAYEREYGLHCVAFVGKGKTAQIAAGYPKVLSIDGMSLQFETELDDNIGSFTATTIARMSDVDQTLVNFIWRGEGRTYYTGNPTQEVTVFEEKATLADTEVILPMEFATRTVTLSGGKICFDYVQKEGAFPASYQPSKAKAALYAIDVQFEDNRTKISKTGISAVGRYSQGHAYESLYGLGSTILVSDALFEEISQGREGTYAYAVTPMPKEKAAIQALVNRARDGNAGVRYPIMNAISYELEAMNETFATLAALFRYIAIGMAVFAALMFWNFISGSISQKKKEIGIMRALGARGRDVFLIFFTESFIVAVACFLLGSLLTFGMSLAGNMVIRNTIGILLSLLTFTPRQAILICLLSFAVAVIGSSLPIWCIAKKKPVDAIRKN